MRNIQRSTLKARSSTFEAEWKATRQLVRETLIDRILSILIVLRLLV